MFHEPEAPVSSTGAFTTSIPATLCDVLFMEPAWNNRWKNILGYFQGLVLFYLSCIILPVHKVFSFAVFRVRDIFIICNIYPNRCHNRYQPIMPASDLWYLSMWWKSDGETRTQPLRLILGLVPFDVRQLNPRRWSSELPAVCVRVSDIVSLLFQTSCSFWTN